MSSLYRMCVLPLLVVSGCGIELASSGDVAPEDGQTQIAPVLPSADADAGTSQPPTLGLPGATAGGAASGLATDASLVADAGVLAPSADTGVPAAMAESPELSLASPAFESGDKLPEPFACDGESPPFTWSGVPAGTQSFALVLTTRANVWNMVYAETPWALWDIPAAERSLPEGVEPGASPPNVVGAHQAGGAAATSTGGFGGYPGGGFPFGAGTSNPPDPDAGHHYQGPCNANLAKTFEFTLYALADAPPAALGASATPDEVVSWIETEATILAQSSVNGEYP